MKTKMITKVILTVLTLALGIRPRDEALLVSSSLPLLFPAALEAAAQLVIAKVRGQSESTQSVVIVLLYIDALLNVVSLYLGFHPM